MKQPQFLTSSRGVVSADTTQRCLPLKQHRLAIEDRKCFFEPRNFCFLAGLALSVGVRLGDAHVVELAKVVVDCVEFLLHGGTVGGCLRNGLVEAFKLLGLVPHGLLLRNCSASCFDRSSTSL